MHFKLNYSFVSDDESYKPNRVAVVELAQNLLATHLMLMERRWPTTPLIAGWLAKLVVVSTFRYALSLSRTVCSPTVSSTQTVSTKSTSTSTARWPLWASEMALLASGLHSASS